MAEENKNENAAAPASLVGRLVITQGGFMNQPNIFMADAIKNWDCDKELQNGVWVPARPIGGGFSWTWRWKLAWGVLTGKYDALNWE